MLWSRKDEEPEFRPLADGVDDSEDADSRQSVEQPLRRRPSRRRANRLVYCCISVLFVVSNLISILLGGLISKQVRDLDSICAAHTNKYSPVLKDVKIRFEDMKFNGSFMDVNIYRQRGSPEVDAAWEALGVNYRAGVIPASEGPASGLTSAHVQRADKYGGGFFVNVEGMHHLHCLNLLRQALWFNYDYYVKLGQEAFLNEPNIVELHVTHCLDTIRQVLMCNVDTGVLGQVWYDRGTVAAFPDFKTTHTCKNYDDVRKWAEKLQEVPLDQLPDDYMKAPDPKDVLSYTP